jgi:hypothetical protein
MLRLELLVFNDEWILFYSRGGGGDGVYGVAVELEGLVVLPAGAGWLVLEVEA